ncbi:MAG: hypothetical protein LBB08_02655 [Rickettsiales bacterium]|jgi:hypothetical protein|nr:hypothetical protein [Rickettsiales bacterium]
MAPMPEGRLFFVLETKRDGATRAVIPPIKTGRCHGRQNGILKKTAAPLSKQLKIAELEHVVAELANARTKLDEITSK